MKLLLHTCCGPCFLGVWEDLQGKGFEITNYYNNPNIYPEEEYLKRLENLHQSAKEKTAEVVVAKYEPELHAQAILGQEQDFPGRCLNCYRIRLEQTAEYAKKHGFEAFSTTLFVSPYQQHDSLRLICEEISSKTSVTFYYQDWRPHFREGQNVARDGGIYLQKYCGCKYSLNESKG
jgi:predicted adenine nucleotide alpha hydrolase (AANH) superfamily ATPase